jgi:hypothetical protein
VSYAAPERFRLVGIRNRALDGITDEEIQAHLDDAAEEINELLRNRNVTVPVVDAGAVVALGGIEIRIAAVDLLLASGTPPDDPGIQAAITRANAARERLEGLASGLRNTAAAALSGGGLIQAIPPADADGNEEADWWA